MTMDNKPVVNTYWELINIKAGLTCIVSAFQMWDKGIQRLYYVSEDVLTNSSDSKIRAKNCFQDSSRNKPNLCLNATQLTKITYHYIKPSVLSRFSGPSLWQKILDIINKSLKYHSNIRINSIRKRITPLRLREWYKIIYPTK